MAQPSRSYQRRPSLAPKAPTKLTATLSVREPAFVLAWGDNSDNEAGFRIETTNSPEGAWEFLAATGPNVTTYQDQLADAREYRAYRVCAARKPVYSNWSNVAVGGETAATPGPALELAAPAAGPDRVTMIRITFEWPAAQAGGSTRTPGVLRGDSSRSRGGTGTKSCDYCEVQWSRDGSFHDLSDNTYQHTKGNRTSPLLLSFKPPSEEIGTTVYYRARAIVDGCATAYSDVLPIFTLPSGEAWPCGFTVIATPIHDAGFPLIAVSFHPVDGASQYELRLVDEDCTNPKEPRTWFAYGPNSSSQPLGRFSRNYTVVMTLKGSNRYRVEAMAFCEGREIHGCPASVTTFLAPDAQFAIVGDGQYKDYLSTGAWESMPDGSGQAWVLWSIRIHRTGEFELSKLSNAARELIHAGIVTDLDWISVIPDVVPPPPAEAPPPCYESMTFSLSPFLTPCSGQKATLLLSGSCPERSGASLTIPGLGANGADVVLYPVRSGISID